MDEETITKNFDDEYVKEMGYKEVVLFLKAGHKIPDRWKNLPNFRKGLRTFNEDPNASFFAKHKKSTK